MTWNMFFMMIPLNMFVNIDGFLDQPESDLDFKDEERKYVLTLASYACKCYHVMYGTYKVPGPAHLLVHDLIFWSPIMTLWKKILSILEQHWFNDFGSS